MRLEIIELDPTLPTSVAYRSTPPVIPLFLEPMPWSNLVRSYEFIHGYHATEHIGPAGFRFLS